MISKSKNLLVISPYPDRYNKDIGGIFVKDQISLIKKYFNEIIVIEPIPWVPKFLLNCFKTHRRSRFEKNNYQYDNVKVYYPKFFILPFYMDFFDIFRLKAVKNVIKKQNLKFDLIHAHMSWPCGYIGAKLKEICGIFVLTIHGEPFKTFASKNLKNYSFQAKKRKIFFSLKIADKITTPHPDLFFDLCSLNYEQKTIMIEKNVDFERFGNFDKYKNPILKFKKENGLESKKVITFLARLSPEKDPLTFIRSIQYVIEKNNEVIFLIVGDGILRERVIREIKKLRLQSYCRFLGQRADRHLIYLSSDIFCALSPVENIWSGTVQEAFASGVPCIITNVGHSGKYLKDKQNAILIPPKDPEKLANIILELLNEHNLRKIIADNAKKMAKNRWYSNKIDLEWLDFYNKLFT